MNPIIKFIYTIVTILIGIPSLIILLIGGLIEYIGSKISDLGEWMMNKIS